jgi:tRNA threonylcarbamoyl adenosine modification protein YeaZ
MTIWLGIDTSSGTSVAIGDGATLLAEINFQDTMGHAENIGDAIAQVLQSAKLAPRDIDAVVVGRGPAPFTGLRVGIAAAVAFAEGIGVPLYGVVSHEAIALSALSAEAASETAHLVVRTDARRREEYWSLYTGLDESGLPNRSAGPAVASAQAIEAELERLAGSNSTAQAQVSAASIVRLAHLQQSAGVLDGEVSALYLRAPDATEPKVHGRFGKPVSG